MDSLRKGFMEEVILELSSEKENPLLEEDGREGEGHFRAGEQLESRHRENLQK
jgi:hypothetical protein